MSVEADEKKELERSVGKGRKREGWKCMWK